MLLPLAYPKISCIFVPQIKGEVLEWLKRYAWKAYIPLKGIESSNLFLSAGRSGQNQTTTGQKLTSE